MIARLGTAWPCSRLPLHWRRCSPAAPAPEAAAPAPAVADLSVKDEEKTALDAYVAKPDPAYKWELKATYPGDGQTTYVLEMTSQTWRTEADVDRPVWTHWMTIVKPTEVKSDKALLFIWQGDNTDPGADQGAGPLHPHREGNRLGRRRSRHGAEPAAALH